MKRYLSFFVIINLSHLLAACASTLTFQQAGRDLKDEKYAIKQLSCEQLDQAMGNTYMNVALMSGKLEELNDSVDSSSVNGQSFRQTIYESTQIYRIQKAEFKKRCRGKPEYLLISSQTSPTKLLSLP